MSAGTAVSRSSTASAGSAADAVAKIRRVFFMSKKVLATMLAATMLMGATASTVSAAGFTADGRC